MCLREKERERVCVCVCAWMRMCTCGVVGGQGSDDGGKKEM